MDQFDRDRVINNVREADTEDLLDRVTAFRDAMEPEAVAIIEEELARRGIEGDDIQRHASETCLDILRDADGWAYRCSFCNRPAVLRRWGWHRLWGMAPIPFPRLYNYCRAHRPELAEPQADPEDV
jgi:hypothetical protein